MSNNLSTNNKNTVITKTPLTREEMALYIEYMNNSINVMKEGFISAIENMCVINKKQNEELVGAIKTLTNEYQQTNALLTQEYHETNSILNKMTNKTDIKSKTVSEFSEKDKRDWMNKIFDTCKEIGRMSDKNELRVLSDIYKLSQTNGVDIYAAFEEYKKENPHHPVKIRMCSESSVLRESIENSIQELQNKYGRVVKKKKCYSPSTELMTVPKEIENLYSHYMKNHKVTREAAVASMNADLKRRTGRDIPKERFEYAVKHGYKNCSSAYYIAHTPELMKVFKQISEERYGR